MTAIRKVFAQLTRETVDFERGVATIDVPDKDSAKYYASVSNVLFMKVYEAEVPDDALAAKQPYIYTMNERSTLRDTAQVVNYLETLKADPAQAEKLPHLFSRLTRDAALQEKFNLASRKAGTEKIDAVIGLLKTELPEESFLTPLRGGFIRMEKGDICIGADLNTRFPPIAPDGPKFTIILR
ncbi:MAG: hypothetical protein PSY14_05320 [bacterium]|nr:hypothetical protein [bacterium]